jgi:hypothetical protein
MRGRISPHKALEIQHETAARPSPHRTHPRAARTLGSTLLRNFYFAFHADH